MPGFQLPERREVLKRMTKYFIEWLVIAFASKMIPSQKIEVCEVVMIATVGACVFALLDMFSPTVSNAARTGAGFMLGLKTVL